MVTPISIRISFAAEEKFIPLSYFSRYRCLNIQRKLPYLKILLDGRRITEYLWIAGHPKQEYIDAVETVTPVFELLPSKPIDRLTVPLELQHDSV